MGHYLAYAGLEPDYTHRLLYLKDLLASTVAQEINLFSQPSVFLEGLRFASLLRTSCGTGAIVEHHLI